MVGKDFIREMEGPMRPAKKHALPARDEIDAELLMITGVMFDLASRLDKLAERIQERERNRFRPCD